MVVATQNPLEFVGIYPLVESQLDRFLLRFQIGYPDEDSELRVVKTYRRRNLDDPLSQVSQVLSLEQVRELQRLAQEVVISDDVLRYIIRIVRRSREIPELMLPLSPRSAINLSRAVSALALLRGRAYVIPDDVKELAVPVLAHRIFKGAHYDPKANEEIVNELLREVEVPI